MSSQEDINKETSGRNSKDAMFEPNPKPKMIRVLTVLAYVLSVSMAAILLSLYYIFMWDGRPHIGARRSSDDMSIQQNKNISYMVPTFSRHISDGSNNNSDIIRNDYLNVKRINNYYISSSSDALIRMANETSDDYENATNITLIALNETELDIYHSKSTSEETTRNIKKKTRNIHYTSFNGIPSIFN